MNTTTNLLRSLSSRSKKITLVVALLMTAATSFSFAAAAPNDDLRGVIKTSFQHDFKGATLINAENNQTFTKLTFTLDNTVMFAYYSEKGDLLAISRNISTSQLPIQLLIQLKNEYSSYWVSALIEVTKNGETNYYLTVENADTKKILQAGSNFDHWNLNKQFAK